MIVFKLHNINIVYKLNILHTLNKFKRCRNMGKVIAFANQKGGVAKTTSTYNVGVSLAKKGKKH